MRWPSDSLDLTDPINQEIWRDSPLRQIGIQPPCLGTLGQVGAMQALLGDSALPWVPDLVGSRWRTPGSVLIFGSSYADFFSPLSSRDSKSKTPYEADNAGAFCRRFAEQVATGDRHYYDPIQTLLKAVGLSPAQVVLTDLNRSSFVEIQQGKTSASESVLRQNGALFSRYIQANQDWHQARLAAFEGRVLVALGGLAAQGVAALLGDEAFACEDWMKRPRPPTSSQHHWRGRAFTLIHVPHPAAWGTNPVDRAGALARALGVQLRRPEDHRPSRRRRVSHAATPSPPPVIAPKRGPLDPWALAFRVSSPLPAADLLQAHPDATALTQRLFQGEITAARVVAFCNAAYNRCSSKKLQTLGLAQTPASAWGELLSRMDTPFQRRGTQWERLCEVLDPVPSDVAKRIQGMNITQLCSMARAIIRDVYRGL